MKFEKFLKKNTTKLSRSKYDEWNQKLKEAIGGSLAAYQKQMSILAYLEPGPFSESRVPIKIEDAHVGIIHNGNYYLLPICEPGTSDPLDVRTARSQIVNILSLAPKEPARLKKIARVQLNQFLTRQGGSKTFVFVLQ
jgi:hypothetical protein